MYCPNCGTKNENEARFCSECGSPFAEAQRATMNESMSSNNGMAGGAIQSGQSVNGRVSTMSANKRRVIAAVLVAAILAVGCFFGWNELKTYPMPVVNSLADGGVESYSPILVHVEGTGFAGLHVSEDQSATSDDTAIELRKGSYVLEGRGAIATDEGEYYEAQGNAIEVTVDDNGVRGYDKTAILRFDRVFPIDVTDDQISKLEETIRAAGEDEATVEHYSSAVKRMRNQALQERSLWVGDWTLIEMTESGQVTSQSDIQLLSNMGMKVALTLNEDGSGVLNLFGEQTLMDWKYEENGRGVITVDDGDPIDIALQDGKVTMSSNGSMLVFGR